MKHLKRIVLLGVVSIHSGCAVSRATSFRDPSAAGVTYSTLAVFAIGMEMRNAVAVEEQVCARLAPTVCVPGKSIAPPTRAYSNEEFGAILKEAGVEGVILVALVSDQSRTRYAGTSTTSTSHTTGNVNLYGDAAMWNGSSTTQTTSSPQYVTTRAAVADVGLFDRASGRIAWRGEISVSSQGVLATDGAFVRAAASRLAKELRAKGLVQASQ